MKWLLSKICSFEEVQTIIKTIITDEDQAFMSAFKSFITEINKNNDVLLADAKAANYSSFFSSVQPEIFTDTSFTQRKKLMTLKPGYTKIRVYMWLEGQDMDCYTGASGTYLDFDIKLGIDTYQGG